MNRTRLKIMFNENVIVQFFSGVAVKTKPSKGKSTVKGSYFFSVPHR